jgi:ABC-type dipeptide/oligopeptide/nickel transport system permease subunit
MSSKPVVVVNVSQFSQGVTAKRMRSPLDVAMHRFIRQPAGVIGLGVFIAVVVVAVAASVVAPYSPLEMFARKELQAPGAMFPLGADHLGRDILSRIIFGTRVSLMVGVIAVALGSGVGGISGLIAGYSGGWVDGLIMRMWDAVFAVPAVLLGIALAAALGPSSSNAAIAIGIATMPTFARIARAAVIAESGKEYVQAAVALGIPTARILARHIVPNVVGPLLVMMALTMGNAVLLEAGLSFLGLGTQPPDPSWGGMLNESRQFLRDAPWFGVFPGIALTVLVLGLNSFADAMRDALDPRSIQ